MVEAVARPSGVKFEELRRRLAGEVIEPDDERYDDARRVWNAMFDRRPAVIARVTSPRDVAEAIRFGREHDLQIAVRSGGHSAAGHSTCDDGLVIDLTLMRGVTIDPSRRTATVSGGALLSQLDRAAQEHGLVCPVGIVGHTGVSGLTLGGGMGRLQRKLGYTIDSLRGVEVVTAEGAIVRASETENPDLFWGIRGAGANFGVVTEFLFDIHPFDGMLTRGLRMYDAKDIHEVWPVVREFGAGAADELSMTCGIARAERAGDYPESVAGRPIFYAAFNHCGDEAKVEADVAALNAGPKPFSSTLTRVPYLQIQGANDEVMGFGHRTYIRGAFANDFRAETLDAVVAHVGTAADGESTFGLTLQGGALARVDESSTPFTGRSALFEVDADTSWTDAAADDERMTWVRTMMAILEPDTVPGRYVNEMPDSSPEETLAIYGAETYGRLAELKRTWDPENVFRLNHNVTPA
jgi:FAD/FMN-containing dehydrogenase